MKEYIEKIRLAKARIDNGFSQVGKKFDKADPVAHALASLAARSISTANSILLLCRNDHTLEALPLLRSLLEISMRMNWIVQEDSVARARAERDDLNRDGWWPNNLFRERAPALGYSSALIEAILRGCYDHIHGGAAGVPWGHVFEEKPRAVIVTEDVLRATTAAMNNVIKTLEITWPGKFSEAP